MAENNQEGIFNEQMALESLNNSNSLSIMSMIIGLNCRLNVQENLLREILEKVTAEKENDDGRGKSDENQLIGLKKEPSGDASAGIEVNGFELMNHFVSSMVTPIRDGEAEVDEKEITCYECKQIFVRGTGEFTRHLRETSCKPYACDICDKLFKKKSNMKTHRLTHSEGTAVCSVCGASFKCDQYLKNHQKRVHQLAFSKDQEEASNDTDQKFEPPAKRVKTSSPSSPSPSPSADSKVIPRNIFDETYEHLMNFEMKKFDK